MKPHLALLGKSIVVYGLGDLLAKSLGLIAIPLYTRLLTPDDYGVISVAAAVSAVASVITNFGISGAAIRAYYEENSFDNHVIAVSTGFWAITAWSGCVLAVALVLAVPLSALFFGTGARWTVIVLAFLGVPFVQILAYTQDILRIHFRTWSVIALSLGSQIVQIALAYVFIARFDMGTTGFFVSLIVANLAATFLGVAFIWRELRMRFSRRLAREYAAIGSPIALSGLANNLFAVTDRNVLSRFVGLDAAGMLTVATSIASMMYLVTGAFGRGWSAIAWKMRQEMPDYKAAYVDILLYFLTVISVAAVGLSCFAPEVVAIMTPPSYRGAAGAIPPLAIYMFANGSTQVTALGIGLTGRTGYLATLYWSAALLNLVLDLVFVRFWGMLGVAWATTCVEVALTIALAVVTQRLHPLPYDIRRLAALSLVFLGFVVMTYALPSGFVLPIVLLKLCFVGVYCIMLLVLRIITPSDLTAALSFARIGRNAESKT
ncbi:MAG TPA: lipopolysaccharide biosynthesis protein [Stellaceae bacterium]|nr:lipopolysaccharide biosynthesis protein [Stellaceae bacterium]